MIIGSLKALGEMWPRAARNVQEIQRIARHVLGLESRGSNGSRSSSTFGSTGVPSLSNDGEQSGTDRTGSSDDVYSAGDDVNNLCSWFNNEDGPGDFAWWMAHEDQAIV